jgi:hypothetical protein
MAPKVSKKSQADLISLVKSAGWKEDQKTQREWRWFDPKIPGIYYRLADAAAFVTSQRTGVAKHELNSPASAAEKGLEA